MTRQPSTRNFNRAGTKRIQPHPAAPTTSPTASSARSGGMQREQATNQIADWLTEPRRQGLVLPLNGPAGAGKTSLLESIRSQFTGSLYLDCGGLTAEQVVHTLLDELGIDISAKRGHYRLFDALSGYRGHAIALLANTQWAGSTFTSNEPRRIARNVAEAFGWHSSGCIRVVVEGDSAPDRRPVHRSNEIILSGEAGTPEPASLLGDFPLLRPLAAAELRYVPFEVWEFLSSALGIPATSAELRRVAEQIPEVLTTDERSDGPAYVAFRSASIKQRIRLQSPLVNSEQLRITDALLAAATAHDAGPVKAYAARSLPLHAAWAGVLPDLMDNRVSLVAHSERGALLQGMALAWPDGVPMGRIAADVHYLQEEGVAPASHGEWLAWLHWAASNRGRRDWADQLATSGAQLPWRTVWAKWRPYGLLGSYPGETVLLTT